MKPRLGLSLYGSIRYSFGHKPAPYTGLPYEQVLANRKKFVRPFPAYYYKEPLLITEGYKEYLYDHQGKQYIDLMGGFSVTSVGHSHPRLLKIYQEQVDRLMHVSPIYMNEYQGQYSKRLCQELGPEYDSVYLCNSGSQANDFAVQLSRLYTGNQKMFSLRNSYHGGHGYAAGLTAIKTWNSPAVRTIEIENLAWPNLYRSPQKDLETLIQDADQQFETGSNGNIAGFIAEPVMGSSGVIPMPDGYLKRMYQLTRKYNGLCISDEVQTGFGRVGKDGWGFKWQGVKPDIIVTAKAIANGYPMAAVISRKEIMDCIKHVFFNTFGGGPLQCRLGIEVLNILKEQNLYQNADKVGGYILKQLKRIQGKCRILGDVRGKGLFIGQEYVKDKESKEPAPQIANQVTEKLRERGLLIIKAGPRANCTRIVSPLCLSMENAQKVISIYEQVVTKI